MLPPPGARSELRLRQAEACVLGGDDEVAGEDELEPSAEGEALDRRDHGLREAPDRIGRRAADVHEGAVVLGADVDVVLDVRTRRKRASGAVQNPHCAVACLEAGERLSEAAKHVGVERVQLVGTVQGDPRDPVALLVENGNAGRTGFHGSLTPPASRRLTPPGPSVLDAGPRSIHPTFPIMPIIQSRRGHCPNDSIKEALQW